MSTWEDTKHHLAFRDIKLNTTGSYCSHPLQRRWPRRQTMTSVDKDVHKLCLSNCCSECNAHWKMTWEFLKMFNRGRPLAWQLRCEGLGSIPGRVPPSADPGRQQSQVWLPHGQPQTAFLASGTGPPVPQVWRHFNNERADGSTSLCSSPKLCKMLHLAVT